jgi:tRNA pseudouridine13 synthase
VKPPRDPDDFEVEETTDFAASAGPFALYRLSKRSIGTAEAVESIARRWNLSMRAVSFGGRKDRHAATRQLLTIRGGPRSGLRDDRYDLAYLGQAPRAFGPRDIAGNRFVIVLRGLDPARKARIDEALGAVERDGLPNYFDDQRFGSLGESGELVARAWCEGSYERALWLALADRNPHDSSAEREEKQRIREGWKDWTICKATLSRSHRRSIVSYLADHPSDFRGAFERLRRDLRSLYLSAYQSLLWNRILSSWIAEVCRDEAPFRVPLRSGDALFPRSFDPAQRAALDVAIPLPSARTRFDDPALRARVERSLAELGLELGALRVRHGRDSFFSRGERRALVKPAALASEWALDEIHGGREKLVLRFTLPRGSYATLLVKRVTARC